MQTLELLLTNLDLEIFVSEKSIDRSENFAAYSLFRGGFCNRDFGALRVGKSQVGGGCQSENTPSATDPADKGFTTT